MAKNAKAHPKSHPEAHSRQAPQRAPGWQDPMRPVNPTVSAGWLLKWVAVAIAAAALCAYAALCLLFYQGQWQIVFHPSRVVKMTPTVVGLAYDDIRFAYTETGKAQLSGWWIPAEAGSDFAAYTLVYMHGASGSLSDCVDPLRRLHSLGINIFAFDYRGFGVSDNTHPSEQRVYEDADWAMAYLTDTRHIDASHIVLHGEGLGATIAAETALRHSSVAGLILENPAPPARDLIAADARTSLIPAKLLFRDRFELTPRLSALKMPKLLLKRRANSSAPLLSPQDPAQYPKTIVTVTATDADYLSSIRHFLDENLAHR